MQVRILPGAPPKIISRPRAWGGADRLSALFGADRVLVELIDHLLPDDSLINDALAGLAADRKLPVVATNNVHYARPAEHKIAASLPAVRARRDLHAMDGWQPTPGMVVLRSGDKIAPRLARYRRGCATSPSPAPKCATAPATNARTPTGAWNMSWR